MFVDSSASNLNEVFVVVHVRVEQVLNQSEPWHPWFDDAGETNFPLGYATNYVPIGFPENGLSVSLSRQNSLRTHTFQFLKVF
jgi:hypothetical protein